MHEPPIAPMVKQLLLVGKSIREITRILKISRNTVRKWLRQETIPESEDPLFKNEKEQELVQLIRSLLPSCRGNLVRVHEILTNEHQQNLAYSSLTYLVRKYQLKETGKPKRFGEYFYDPGVEMQHDTSPHQLMINGQSVKAQCASLVFGFSRKLFIQYYPCFTRFEAKTFLREALLFMGGSCKRCIIDNTSVILAAGAGANAVVAPEMLFFSRAFGFTFIAHAVGDANRKGKCERPFYYVETNFLAGRTFMDWQDLNQQARLWSETVSNAKPKRSIGVSPNTAFIQEMPALIPLPAVMTPIYKNVQRIVDTRGFVNLDSNRYSVPESHIGHTMDLYQYMDRIDIYYQNRLIAQHPRIMGHHQKQSTLPGHHPSLRRRERQQEMSEAERQLTGHHPVLDQYLTTLKSHVRGRGGASFKHLLQLKQTYPFKAFMVAVTQASHYGLYDMKRLETMILKQIRNDIFTL
ncbi:MAG: transposase [Gammaproteobacteria bacterium]|nr:transposase [Gammaproteobacteria bacterium]